MSAAAAAALGSLLSGVLAATVASRNAVAAAEARDRHLPVAASITAFRDHLGAADEEVAGSLVSGDPPSPLGLSRYEAEILEAGPSLTAAGLVGGGDDAGDIAALAESLARYADLVETSRAYPVGSSFAHVARDLARDDLVPRAAAVRAEAEDEMAATADRGAGPAGAVALTGLTVALAVGAAVALLVAGRTRRLIHPLLVVGIAVLAANLAMTGSGLWTQGREFGAAEAGEIEALTAANSYAFALLDLRVDEMDAVASDDAGPAFARFRRQAHDLLDRLETEEGAAGVLLAGVRAYVAAVAEVEGSALGGDRDAAAAATLEGTSLLSYREVRGIALDVVTRSATDLERRLDAAAGAGVQPLVPLGLGAAAGTLASGGVLARAWRYR